MAIEFQHVTGEWRATAYDSREDPDAEPDLIPLKGRVVFTPKFDAYDRFASLPVTDGANSFRLALLPKVYPVVAGRLQDRQARDGVVLPAVIDGAPVVWTARPDLTTDPGRGIDGLAVASDSITWGPLEPVGGVREVNLATLIDTSVEYPEIIVSQVGALADQAQQSAAEAASSAADAAASAGAVGDSAADAAASAAAAAGSESAAASSATDAAGSASDAAASASDASGSAGAAASSATDAAGSAAAAATSEGNAADSAAAAAQSAADAADVVNDGIPNATSTVKGGLMLAGDLGGTYDSPTVPGLDDKAEAEHSHTVEEVAGLGAALDGKADLVGGVLVSSQLPAVALSKPVAVADRAAMLALVAEEGDVAVITGGADQGSYMLGAGSPSLFGSWVRLVAPDAPVQSVNGQGGTVNLGAADVDAAPEVHSHETADVSGLDAALAGKAPAHVAVFELPTTGVPGTLYLQRNAGA